MIVFLAALLFGGPLDYGTPKCTTEVVAERGHPRCYGIRIHATGDADDAAFVKMQLARANGLFAGIDVAFEVVLSERIDDAAITTTRADRDALGHDRYTRGSIEVFIVDELRDVDDPLDDDGTPNQIRGVHWRDRANRDHRWIIISRIAPEHVLAHELGHYFSLPHGKDPYSIMNKEWREHPPMAERGFVRAEQQKMRAAEKRMRTSGFLVDLHARD